MNNPSLQQWKALYQAALTYKKTGPWNWVWDSDLWGVQNPTTGEIGYCCVMGMIEEHYAFAVYVGAEGLEGYHQMESGELSLFESMCLQKCLMVSFEDRKFLKKQDLALIKELGLTFRGSNEWPLFRNYEPGYAPWFLARDDATFLTTALQQAIDVCLRLKEDTELLNGPTGQYLVRVFDEKEQWTDQWLIPPPFKKPAVVVEIDESRLNPLKRIKQRQKIMEVDFFYSPGGVQEKGERPYYPYTMLMVDHRTGLVLNVHLTGSKGYASEFLERFLTFLEKIKWVPKEIWVKGEEPFIVLEHVASYLGITLKKVEELPALERARASMAGLMMR